MSSKLECTCVLYHVCLLVYCVLCVCCVPFTHIHTHTHKHTVYFELLSDPDHWVSTIKSIGLPPTSYPLATSRDKFGLVRSDRMYVSCWLAGKAYLTKQNRCDRFSERKDSLDKQVGLWTKVNAAGEVSSAPLETCVSWFEYCEAVFAHVVDQ